MVNNSFFVFPISGELASLDLQFVWLGHHNTMVDPKPAANINNIISPFRYWGQGCRDVGLLLLRLIASGHGGSICDSDCLALLGSVPEAKIPVPSPTGRLATPSTED